jgi:hypothetical protein
MRPGGRVLINRLASGDYQKLSAKRHSGPWLDRIAAYFDLSIAAFDNPKVRPIIRQWRNRYAETPRTADMGTQVLSRVCAYAVEQGKLAANPCEGIKASPTAPPSSGPTPTLFEPNNPALRRLRTPSTWRLRPA